MITATQAASLAATTNYYRGTFYFTQSGALQVVNSFNLTNCTIQKTPRGFIVKNTNGQTLGPKGWK
jgi:hypothetical protein